MNHPTTSPDEDDQTRQHPESPAEGSDDAAVVADQPREHTEDPAEG